MITFTCPKCAKALIAPDDGAGREGRCACGATFVVPWPPQSEPLTPPPREVDYEPEPDDEPEPYRPRRRRAAGNTGRRVALFGLLLLAVVASVWIGVRWARHERSAPGERGPDRG